MSNEWAFCDGIDRAPFDEAVDIFTDASSKRSQKKSHRIRFSGAYIIGRCNEPVGLSLSCSSSLEAEILTMVLAILEAARRGVRGTVVHCDLAEIQSLLKKQRMTATRCLASVANANDATIKSDGKLFSEHRKCHVAARIQAGHYGGRYAKMEPIGFEDIVGGEAMVTF